MMIEGAFDSRTLANMNEALERVCGETLQGDEHPVRKRVARRIVQSARSGNTTLGQFTAAGQRALIKSRPALKQASPGD